MNEALDIVIQDSSEHTKCFNHEKEFPTPTSLRAPLVEPQMNEVSLCLTAQSLLSFLLFRHPILILILL